MNRQTNKAEDKLAIVTGGGAGIGVDIVLSLAKQGWDTVINYWHSAEQANQVAEKATDFGVQALCVQADVGNAQDIGNLFDLCIQHFGKTPNLLVNNAAVQTWSSFLDLAEEDWASTIQTNLTGCFLTSQKFARNLVRDGKKGAIVNIGSGCNKLAFPNLVDYTASKGGLEMLTKSVAVELAPHGIRVNCVAPGAIETGRTQAEADGYAEIWGDFTPMGRVGTPDDVAKAVLFFANQDSDYITGQTLWVDGGVFTKANWPYQNDPPGKN